MHGNFSFQQRLADSGPAQARKQACALCVCGVSFQVTAAWKCRVCSEIVAAIAMLTGSPWLRWTALWGPCGCLVVQSGAKCQNCHARTCRRRRQQGSVTLVSVALANGSDNLPRASVRPCITVCTHWRPAPRHTPQTTLTDRQVRPPQAGAEKVQT